MKKLWNKLTPMTAMIGIAVAISVPSSVFATGGGGGAAEDMTKPAVGQILIKNVNIFNGIDNTLTPGDVLVENNLIKAIGKDLQADEGATVIEGDGRTLMPGLIDGLRAHLSTRVSFRGAKHSSTFG